MRTPLKIMFLGTGSDVGKSITVTAFCRILKQKGYSVAPFKAQNMSNNSYVTIEGGEIGRAQVAQAEAAGLAPSIHMNPVLLKPNSQIGSQVILQGRVHGNMTAKEYYDFKPAVKSFVMGSYQQLAQKYELIVIEGAGSCCEVNLRAHDIVNFEMAFSVNAPVILIADIERGGVFAQIIGSLEIISPKERDLVQGFIINKFRGDPDLFKDGIAYIEQRTGKPVLGVVPYLPELMIDKEDSMALDAQTHKELMRGSIINSKIGMEIEMDRKMDNKINIAAIRLPHISNFTDLEVLEREPETILHWLTSPTELSAYDIFILPGSKSSLYDMTWLHKSGWTEKIRQFAEADKWIIGLCGGFQMLGRKITDPGSHEGGLNEVEGLGLLDIDTVIQPIKIVRCTEGKECLFGEKVSGYEIHMGESHLFGHSLPFLELTEEGLFDGAINERGNIFGTYLHGLFDAVGFRRRFLSRIAAKKGIPFKLSAGQGNFREEKEKHYDLLAAHFIQYTDVDQIMRIIKDYS